MAETPKGDTASPTDAPDPDRTLAGDAGEDHLAGAERDGTAGPWSADSPERASELRADGGREDGRREAENRSAGTGGGLRRALILAILLVLAVGGAYATYPMWRDRVEPLARQIGVSLPGSGTPVAEAPTAEAPAAVSPPATADSPSAPPVTAAAPAQQPPSGPSAEEAPAAAGPNAAGGPTSPPPEGSAPAPASSEPASADATPQAPAADPALVAEVERLNERVSTLDDRLAALETRAPEAPKADAAALEDLRTRVGTMAERLTAVSDEMAIVREGLAAGGGGEGLGPMAAQLSDRLQGLTDRIAALEEQSRAPADTPDRLQALADRVAAVEQQAKAPPPEPAVRPEAIDDLQARVETLAGSLDSEVRNSAEDVARLETRLSDMQARLDELGRQLQATRSGQEKAGAFLLAANQLAAATATSGNFDSELQAVRAAAPKGDEVARALDVLAQHAADGVPSLAVLRNRFGPQASAAVDASVVGSGEGVVGQALTRIASLVTVRRTDTADEGGLDALLLRAETALAAGDLPGAIQAVRKLDGAPAQAVSQWLAAAEARAAVDAATRALQSQALAGVAGG